MTRSPRTRLALAAAVVIAVASALVVALLIGGRDTGPEDPHGHGDGEFGVLGPQPEGADPATAARGGLKATFSWQPATDVSSGQGLVRAKPWLAGQMLADASVPVTGSAVRPPAEWESWRAAGDIVTALVNIDGSSAPERGECLVTATVTQMVQHTDGTSTRWRVLKIAASMTSTEHGWRLANYRVTG
ncbi:hypothetical protein [Nocardia sp. NPDC127526]|uniref:hypothetical protein n=1 Tax=Nocardia sp. NPDC127526 TaxID=3345393 RepID=UPI00362A0D60